MLHQYIILSRWGMPVPEDPLRAKSTPETKFSSPKTCVQVLQHSIILSHWGMTAPEDRCSIHDWIHSYERCRHLPKYPVAAGALPCHVPDKVRPRSGCSVSAYNSQVPQV